ncbi:hypothetical protein [Clostridium sp. LIBA-8841]|uniref:hypothetical protein n=1 Tax=Clostridium sp. LIBA-8841 TaxID=2987530 RepID=UPI002AC46FDC|nr:hypothetical protein [Clostridium sp. LIBA-8841]MDZ5253050.1 hypothetical protein [Clostridium sp. LIBA-8841]
MKKGNLLQWLLFSLALIIVVVLLVDFREEENKGALFHNFIEEENNSEFHVLNEFNFKVNDTEGISGELVKNDEKLYLQKRNNDYEIIEKYKIIFEEGTAKKVKCNDLKDETIKEEINEEEYTYGYKYEDLGNGKGKFFDSDYNKDFHVNLDKFNKDEMAQKTYGEYEYSDIIENKLLFFIRRDPGKIKLFSDDDSRYKEIRWYDFEKEIWDNVKISKNQHISSIIGIVDNKIYLTGTKEWGSQFPSKIYSVDLEKKKVNEERGLQHIGDSYYDICSLDKENILVEIGTSEGGKIRVINLREKIFSDLFQHEYSQEVWLNEILSPSKDKIFHHLKYDGMGEIKVIDIKEGKPNGAIKVYEYESSSASSCERYKPQVIWSKDGRYLIIAEYKTEKNEIFNFKILEFNQ